MSKNKKNKGWAIEITGKYAKKVRVSHGEPNPKGIINCLKDYLCIFDGKEEGYPNPFEGEITINITRQ